MKFEHAYTKADLINNLRAIVARDGVGIEDEYGHNDFRGSRTTMLMADAFADWLEVNAPAEEHQVFVAYVCQHLINAYTDFRTLDIYAHLRKEYTRAMDRDQEIPDLLVPSMDGLLEGRSIARVVALASGQVTRVRTMIEGYLDAPMMTVTQAWRAFVRVAYRPLIERINDERYRGNSGTFGTTELLTWSGIGRVMFTFRRGRDSVTFVADDSDMHGHRSGPNHPACDFIEAVAMIRDVTAHWDIEKLMRDDKIGIF